MIIAIAGIIMNYDAIPWRELSGVLAISLGVGSWLVHRGGYAC